MGTQGDRVRALVVGASAGIGRQIGLRLAEGGADVVFHGRRADLLDEAVATAGSGLAVAAELDDPDACSALVEESVQYLGGLDLLVHAAGVTRLGLITDQTGDGWASIFATNLIAPALVARAALPHLSPAAICAFLSSESVGQPYHGLIPYGSSKAALEELIRGLRVEHPSFRFSCIRVGQTAPTDVSRSFDLDLAGELFPKWMEYGRIRANTMDVVEVGRFIADSLTNALRTPSIEMEDLVLRPPGGPISTSPSAVVDRIADLQGSDASAHS
jgi:NAD(P)-dependent dehydrogenase (short-subunit alcohol dehydrogenase family)